MINMQDGFWLVLEDQEAEEMYHQLNELIINVQFQAELFELRTKLRKYLYK